MAAETDDIVLRINYRTQSVSFGANRGQCQGHTANIQIEDGRIMSWAKNRPHAGHTNIEAFARTIGRCWAMTSK
jgi:hypothetical protein